MPSLLKECHTGGIMMAVKHFHVCFDIAACPAGSTLSILLLFLLLCCHCFFLCSCHLNADGFDMLLACCLLFFSCKDTLISHSVYKHLPACTTRKISSRAHLCHLMKIPLSVRLCHTAGDTHKLKNNESDTQLDRACLASILFQTFPSLLLPPSSLLPTPKSANYPLIQKCLLFLCESILAPVWDSLICLVGVDIEDCVGPQ